jgi:hypothetical protein
MKYDITFSKVILKGVKLELIESGSSSEDLAKGMVDILQGFFNAHKDKFNCESIEVVYEDKFNIYANVKPHATKAYASYATYKSCDDYLMGVLIRLDNGVDINLCESYVFQEAIDIAQQYIKDHPEYGWVKTYKDLKLNV